MNLTERFMEKVFPVTESGCWLWDAYSDKNGYGRFHLRGKPRFSHRVSYELFNGPVADEACVLHRCDVPACVNPNHLFLGTQQENLLDMKRKGRIWSASVTHCKQGHEFTKENLYLRPNGNRRCKTCHDKGMKRYRAEKSPCQ